MASWFGDLKLSFRHLRKTPTFTLTAIVVLALGIGLNAAMFSLVYALGFMGRPYAEPDRIVQLYSSQTTRPNSYRAFSYAAWQRIAEDTSVLSGVLAHSPTLVGVSDGRGDARRTMGVVVSRNYFDVLGVPIIRGRGFTAEEDRPGQDIPVAIASYSYWQRTGLRPDLVGSTIRVNGRVYTIVGIAPRGFTGTMMVFGPELFFPLGVFHTIANEVITGQAQSLVRDDAFNLILVARLAPGATRDAAAERLAALGPQLEEMFPAAYDDARVTLGPLPRFGTSTSPSDESVLGLLGAVLLGLTCAVLLVVCLNLAAMLMARGRARRKEFAVRVALGGSRARIVRQLLTEGLVLACAGGACGVVLGLYAVDALVGAFAAALPITIVLEGATSPAVIVAAILFCVLATSWFALGPALRHSRADVVSDLKPHASEDRPDRRRRFMPRHPLLVAQLALSLALLMAAGLFIRMAQTGLMADFGVDADDTVLAEVDSRLGGYDTAQALDLFATVERRLAALPGAGTASVGAIVPLGLVSITESVRRAGITVAADARPDTPEKGRAYSAPWNATSGGYFAAMGIPLLQGRTFTDAESLIEGSTRVVILDEVLARKLWPDGDALGQGVQFLTHDDAKKPSPAMEVVGIVGTIRHDLFEKEPPGAVYVPFAQGPTTNAYFHVRPAAAGVDLVDAVRQEIRSAAPGLPLFGVKTYKTHIASSIEYWALELSAGLFAAFGALAVLVALVGIYGVMSYTVVRRTREIGIRLAVGASGAAVKRMLLGEGLALTMIGVAIGLVLGVGIGRVMASIFVDMSAFDTVVFTLLPAGLVAAATLAVWIPARRATRVDPMSALRTE